MNKYLKESASSLTVYSFIPTRPDLGFDTEMLFHDEGSMHIFLSSNKAPDTYSLC